MPDFGNELRFRDPGGRLTGAYVPVDFRAHAEAMGATATFARSLGELRAALDRARGNDGVTVIVVPADPEKRMSTYETWWDVPIPAASGREPVEVARSAYDEARTRQRVDLR